MVDEDLISDKMQSIELEIRGRNVSSKDLESFGLGLIALSRFVKQFPNVTHLRLARMSIENSGTLNLWALGDNGQYLNWPLLEKVESSNVEIRESTLVWLDDLGVELKIENAIYIKSFFGRFLPEKKRKNSKTLGTPNYLR